MSGCKLKTLKDFKKEAQNYIDNPDSTEWVNETNVSVERATGQKLLINDLKTEVIKWIKELGWQPITIQRMRKLFGKDYVDALTDDERKAHMISIIWFIKYTNNITEEDLK